MPDAASISDTSFKRDGIIECGCKMHARRHLVKALDAGMPERRSRPRFAVESARSSSVI